MQSKKIEFKNYMKIQIRYINFISKSLNLTHMQVIEKYAQRFRDLYYKKHEETRTIL